MINAENAAEIYIFPQYTQIWIEVTECANICKETSVAFMIADHSNAALMMHMQNGLLGL